MEYSNSKLQFAEIEYSKLKFEYSNLLIITFLNSKIGIHCKCRYQFFAGLFRNRTSNRYFPWKKLSYTQKKGGSGPLLYWCCGSVPTIFSSNASNYQGKCLLEALFPGIRPVTFAVYRNLYQVLKNRWYSREPLN